MEATALERARQALADDPRSIAVKASEIGVGTSWLRMFIAGRIPDPSFSRSTRVIAWAAGRSHEQTH